MSAVQHRGVLVVAAVLVAAATALGITPGTRDVVARASTGPTLSMSPASTTIAVGETGHFHVELDPDGLGPASPQYLVGEADWGAADRALLARRRAGDFQGLAVGTTTVRAVYRGLVATGSVTVAGRIDPVAVTTPDGRSRSAWVYVPAGYQPGVPSPLVLNFHGALSNSEQQITLSQMNVAANRHDVLVAYPQGTGGQYATWNGGRCCGDAQSRHVDDVGFTRRLLDELSRRYAIDPLRVYATGLSNGGILSHRLACEASDRFAAIADVAGGLNVGGDFRRCAPRRSVSVMMLHGTTDRVYPYNGGRGIFGDQPFHAVEASTRDWRSIDQLLETATAPIYQRGIVTCQTWTAIAVEVELCTARPPAPRSNGFANFDGGGHAWPGGVRWERGDWPTGDQDASEMILTFFLAHPLVAPVPAP